MARNLPERLSFLAGSAKYWILGKLKPCVTPQEATDNLNVVARDNIPMTMASVRLVKRGSDG